VSVVLARYLAAPRRRPLGAAAGRRARGAAAGPAICRRARHLGRLDLLSNGNSRGQTTDAVPRLCKTGDT